MQRIRTWQDIEKLAKAEGKSPGDWLTNGEEDLIQCAIDGDICFLGHGKVPPDATPSPDVHIRAEVLNYVLLGGCKQKKTDPTGIELVGAYISGSIEVSRLQLAGVMFLNHCRIVGEIKMFQSKVQELSLSNSVIFSLAGQGLHVKGSVFLQNTTIKGCVILDVARIGGQLNCKKAEFSSKTGKAISAQSIYVGDSTLFTSMTAHATIEMKNATIEGQIALVGSKLLTTEDIAFNGQSLKCGAFLWKSVTIEGGSVMLSHAQVSVLSDDLDSWPSNGKLDLIHFQYDQIIGSSTEAEDRISWLKSGDHPRDHFTPQPYTHFAKVLKDMGKENDARQVLIAREARVHEVRYADWLAPQRWVVDVPNWIFRYVVGYGYRPWNAVYVLTLLVFATWLPTYHAYHNGDFAPNSDVILTSQAWKDLQASEQNPAAVWAGEIAKIGSTVDTWTPEAAGRDWESFHSLAYAVDVVVPIVDFGQTDAWAPSTTRGPWGKNLYWIKWVALTLGWIVTALGAAAITGLIRKD